MLGQVHRWSGLLWRPWQHCTFSCSRRSASFTSSPCIMRMLAKPMCSAGYADVPQTVSHNPAVGMIAETPTGLPPTLHHRKNPSHLVTCASLPASRYASRAHLHSAFAPEHRSCTCAHLPHPHAWHLFVCRIEAASATINNAACSKQLPDQARVSATADTMRRTTSASRLETRTSGRSRTLCSRAPASCTRRRCASWCSSSSSPGRCAFAGGLSM